jgi:hypothetical protein
MDSTAADTKRPPAACQSGGLPEGSGIHIGEKRKGTTPGEVGRGRAMVFCGCAFDCILFLGGQRLDTPKGPWFASLACFWLLFGAVELLKHFINRSRVDLLKEVKQVQVQVIELQDLSRKEGAR